MTTHTPSWGIAVHTGAGNFTLATLGARQAPMRSIMASALAAGHGVLADGGPSIEAVTRAVVLLEDAPECNAGRGAVFTRDGRHELDAAVMDGRGRRAGAVAGVMRIRNPVLLARRIMDRSPHVMLAGEGAEAFAREVGIEMVDPRYFDTDQAREALRRAQQRAQPEVAPGLETDQPAGYFGTVGAVALDRHGALAAATSTGGMTNKRPGRIGDSPVIGAGTYATDRCAVSATGHGEYFMRYAAAHDICARLEYCGTPVQRACDEALALITAAGGHGGVIAIDWTGEVAMACDVTGMGRGYMGAGGRGSVMLEVGSRQ